MSFCLKIKKRYRPRFGNTKLNKFILYFSQLALSFHKIGCASEKTNLKNCVFHLSFHSACTIFVPEIVINENSLYFRRD